MLLKKHLLFFSAALFPICDIGISASLTSCALVCNEEQWGFSTHEFDSYQINPNHITSDGTRYDPSGQNIDPKTIDMIVNTVSDCLIKAFPDGKLTEEVLNSTQCVSNSIRLPIDRNAFVIKVADNCRLSCDKTQEVLPNNVEAGIQGCLNKGESLQSIEACGGCFWRSGVSCNGGGTPAIISCPNLYLTPDDIVRVVTGCQESWSSKTLAVCAAPLTPPLSQGF
jgi:hypothetical protein